MRLECEKIGKILLFRDNLPYCKCPNIFLKNSHLVTLPTTDCYLNPIVITSINIICCVNTPFTNKSFYSLFRQPSADFSMFLFFARTFRSVPFHSAHFRSLHLHHPFWPNLAKIIPDCSSNLMFYQRVISDSRMFIVLIQT